MADSQSPVVPLLTHRLQTLAAIEPTSLPVISLYLNLAPDQHGRDHYEAFVRKVIPERMKGLTP